MNKHQFYDLSAQLNSVVSSAKLILSLHAGRYKHFVDSSDRGLDCTYAMQTKRLYDNDTNEQEGTLALLHTLKRQLESAIATLEQNHQGKNHV